MVAATGIGSGLDIESLVTQLVAAERVPVENRLFQQEASLTSEISAFGTLQGALANLQSAATPLKNSSTFDQRSGSSSSSAVAVAATSDAAAASYSVEVTQLAQSQSLASASFSSVTDTVGEGTLTFRFGTTDYTPAADPDPAVYNSFTLNADRPAATVTIDSENSSLQGVRDAINSADIGIAAAIVNDGSGFRLLLSSQQTGAANSIEIQVDDTTAGDVSDTDNNGLSRLAFNASADNLEQTVAGQDASFSINGLALTSESNTVTGVIDGVNLTLSDTTDTAATVSITENRAAARGAISSFVNAYNGFIGVANALTDYNAETGVAGALQGDFTARSVINQVRSALTASAEGVDGPFSTLAELGITTQADGTLSINNTTLDAALADNFDSVAAVFAQAGNVSDSNIRFEAATANTVVGSYAINVTQLATQSSLLGTAITGGFPLTIDDNNDTFAISVDGTVSETISLTQASYASGDALAAEFQARINGDSNLSDAGISVAVAVTGSNELQITSNRYGSESAVQITGLDTATTATLGLSLATAAAGLDVAGTIGGVAATGDGQLLTGADGSDGEGIGLTILGGATGSRGTVEISQGISAGLNGLLSGFLQSNGVFDLRTDGLQDSVDRISDDRDALDRRLEALEARYRRQFNALDTLLANLQSTGNFLTQQLANLPVPGNNSNN